MHRLVMEPDGDVVLYIGAENWPSPIPLVHHGQAWYFDTPAAAEEILCRRIGRNELSAIHVCQQLAAAEKEYSARNNQYPQKVVSDDGRHNGLYWKAGNGKPQGFIGPLLASAFIDGFTGQEGAPTPYRGYYFHVLREGKHDARGLAFVAYPAEYRSSGVMTFIVDEGGVVYQKDLGPRTDAIARSMKDYKPDSGWQTAEGQPEESANQTTSHHE